MRFLRSDSSIFTNQYGLTEWGSYSSIFWRTKSNLLFGGLIRQFFDERTRIHFSRSDSSIFWRTKKIIEPKIRVRQRIDGFFRWLTNRPEKWSRGLIRQNSHCSRVLKFDEFSVPLAAFRLGNIITKINFRFNWLMRPPVVR